MPAPANRPHARRRSESPGTRMLVSLARPHDGQPALFDPAHLHEPEDRRKALALLDLATSAPLGNNHESVCAHAASKLLWDTLAAIGPAQLAGEVSHATFPLWLRAVRRPRDASSVHALREALAWRPEGDPESVIADALALAVPFVSNPRLSEWPAPLDGADAPDLALIPEAIEAKFTAAFRAALADRATPGWAAPDRAYRTTELLHEANILRALDAAARSPSSRYWAAGVNADGEDVDIRLDVDSLSAAIELAGELCPFEIGCDTLAVVNELGIELASGIEANGPGAGPSP